MSVDPGVLSAGITAAGTIAVAAIGRLPGKGKDAAMLSGPAAERGAVSEAV
ncbi:MAG: hypothetical protein KH396_08940 [Atopobiaceae bacterium]|nr:hypothetical protein [Atopobiaceae bacterium]